MPPDASDRGRGGPRPRQNALDITDEQFADDDNEEQFTDDDEEQQFTDDDDDEVEQPPEDRLIRIYGLEDVERVIDTPEAYDHHGALCVLRVVFRETPQMVARLHRLQEVTSVEFAGNLDLLKRCGDLHAGLHRLCGSIRTVRATLLAERDIDREEIHAVHKARELLSELCAMQPQCLLDRVDPVMLRLDAILGGRLPLPVAGTPAAVLDKASRDTHPKEPGFHDSDAVFAAGSTETSFVVNSNGANHPKERSFLDPDGVLRAASKEPPCPFVNKDSSANHPIDAVAVVDKPSGCAHREEFVFLDRAALDTKLLQMVEDIEELLLGDVILHYPDADTAEFLPLKEDGAQAQLHWEEPVIRIQGRDHLSALLVQDHCNTLPHSRYIVGELMFRDSENILRDIEEAIEEMGWQVENLEKLRQLRKLNRVFIGIARSVYHVGLALGHGQIDFWELGSIGRNMSEIVCDLQPQQFRAHVAVIIAQIRSALESFPPETENEEDEAPYPPALVATLSQRVEDLTAAIPMLRASRVTYQQ